MSMGRFARAVERTAVGGQGVEQAAGFLRIREAENPPTATYPESYSIVERMAADLNCSVKDLMTNAG